MRLIPAIDIIEGKCVRLTQGAYESKTIYNEDPLEVAKAFEDHGLMYLHLVDLDGAKAGKIVNHKVLERLATHTSLHIDFGGGLKTSDHARQAFECGAQQITGGSIAVKSPEEFRSWIEIYGPEKIILGADVRDRFIAVSGWLEQSEQEVAAFIAQYRSEGIRYVICTDISKDGCLQGPSTALYQDLLANTAASETFPFHLIASGGVSSLSDLDQLMAIGCEGAIIGKAIYEQKISLKALQKYL